MAGINAFKQALLGKNGLSRPSRYLVRIYGPPELSGTASVYQPESVTLPSRSLAMVQEHFHGEQWNIPCGRTFDSSLVMTFPMGQGGNERSYFEYWMDQLVDPETNFAFSDGANGRKDDNYASIEVGVLDGQNNQVQTYLFYDCFPSTVFPMNYGFNMMNDYARLQVQFEYRKYTFQGTAGSIGGTPLDNLYGHGQGNIVGS